MDTPPNTQPDPKTDPLTETKQEPEPSAEQNDPGKTNGVSFEPVLYNFRVSPLNDNNFAVQQPFALLFDNAITVLWAVYCKQSKIQIGINQMQWALEFLKCLKLEHKYPECIGKIVNALELQLIQLYAKVSDKLTEKKEKQEAEKKDDKDDIKQDPEKERRKECVSFNEQDVLDKLNAVTLPIDEKTGEPKYLKELKALGKKKTNDEECKDENKASKNYVIDALQKILKKTAEAGTKSEVEELIKGLNSATPVADAAKKTPAPAKKTV